MELPDTLTCRAYLNVTCSGAYDKRSPRVREDRSANCKFVQVSKRTVENPS